MSQIRRRRLLVDPKLQGSLILHAALYWLYCLLSVSVFAVVWIVFVKRPPTSAKIVEELWMNCGPAILGSIILMPLVLLDCLRVSNRFAGPMVRVQAALKELVAGRTPRPIHLRDGDFWNTIAEDINRLIEKQELREPVVALRRPESIRDLQPAEPITSKPVMTPTQAAVMTPPLPTMNSASSLLAAPIATPPSAGSGGIPASSIYGDLSV